MPESTILNQLLDETYPAMQAASPSAPPEALRRLLVALAAAWAAPARGLSLPERPGENGLHAAAEVARTVLAGLEPCDDAIYLPGELHSRLLGGRHAQGSYFTPPALAAQVAAWALDPLLGAGDPPRVLDPAMGSGHFLVAAGELIAARCGLSRWEAARRLHGVEADPEAAELARLTLWLWAGVPGTAPADLAGRLRGGDALLDDAALAGLPARFDAVLGNPPYASVFTRAQSDDGAYRRALQARYETAAGSFDLAVPFVERALGLCAEGGRVGLVLPNKLLAASYAQALRQWLRERASVEVLADYSAAQPFDAGVYPVVVVLEKRTPSPAAPLRVFDGGGPALLRRGAQADLDAPGGVWSAALDPAWEALRPCVSNGVPLGEVAELAAGLTVAEAYELRGRVFDAAPGPLPSDVLMLLTTGLIRRHHSLWGRKDALVLKRRYARPALPQSALPARRQAQARSRKLVLAGLARRPTAVLDGGLAQAAVSTVIVTGSAWPLGALGAVLNSGIAARLYRALFGGLALAGGYLRFGQRELALLPVPAAPPSDPGVARLDALAADMARADALVRADLDAQIDALVGELYGL